VNGPTPIVSQIAVHGYHPGMADLVKVHTTFSIMEGEIVKARLEAEGVPALLRGEGTGPYRMGAVEVWVPAEMEMHARILLEDPTVEDAEVEDPALEADEDR
jgi:hypothetical protein